MGERFGIESVHGKADSENIPRDYGTEQKFWVGMAGLKNPIGDHFFFSRFSPFLADCCVGRVLKVNLFGQK